MPPINLKIDAKVFNPRYRPYLNDDSRTQIFFGGSSSGKSYFLAQRTVLDLIKGQRNFLICRQVANTIRRSIFNEITKAISFFKLYEYFEINKSDMVITCKLNDNQALFAGLDDTEKIKSISPKKGVITDIWVEEATECEYRAIKQLNKRLRGYSPKKKRLILSFNPIIKSHWLFQEYFSKWDDNKDTYDDGRLLIVKSTYKDNKFLTKEDIEELENETDKYYYEVYTLGNWGVLGSVIFKNYEITDLHSVKREFDKIYNGLDFGFSSDPAAYIRTHYDKKRKIIYVFDELCQTDLTNDVLADKLRPIINREYVLCDSAEPKSIQELKNHGINALPAKKGKDSILHGIQWLQQHKIIIDVNCKHFINEIQQYKWKEDKDGNALAVPIDKYNHLIDALRYAYSKESKGQNWGF